MATGIRVHSPGGPESMKIEEFDLREPGPSEAVVRIEAIGVNFIDIYHRSGLYPQPLPFTPGTEAAGIVERVGADVANAKEGDRVAFIHLGAYADRAVVPAAKLVILPDWMAARTAAASLLQGMTGHYLTTSTFAVQPGERVLVHAAAGGAGSMVVQMAKLRGAYVYGTASTPKLPMVLEAGADRAIDYTTEDFERIILDDTNGVGVHVAYDSVGKTTFEGSLNVLRPRGMLVAFGQSSGPVAPFDMLRLSRKSLYLTRPTIFHYVAERDELIWRANELFESIASGKVRLRIHGEMPLAEAAEAHVLLESRATAGKLLLIP